MNGDMVGIRGKRGHVCDSVAVWETPASRGSKPQCSQLLVRPGHTAALVVAALACASALLMFGCGEPSATVVVTREPGREVLLLPVLRGGTAGWCITVAAGGGCPVLRLMRGTVVAEQWTAEGASKRAEGFALTTNDVAAVAVDGSRTIATRHEPGLPQGLRAVVVTVRGAWAPEVKVPSLFGRHPHEQPEHLPSFTPFDRAGMPLAQNYEAGAFVEREVSGRNWSRPATEPAGVCELRVTHMHGLVANAGFVATHAERMEGLIGRPFFSCASTSYTLEGWPLVASVLVDAHRPGSIPAYLPAMRHIAGSLGLFDALGSNGPMVARRVPGAWLVVSGGEGEAQRRTLLRHLLPTVHL